MNSTTASISKMFSTAQKMGSLYFPTKHITRLYVFLICNIQCGRNAVSGLPGIFQRNLANSLLYKELAKYCLFLGYQMHLQKDENLCFFN